MKCPSPGDAPTHPEQGALSYTPPPPQSAPGEGISRAGLAGRPQVSTPSETLSPPRVHCCASASSPPGHRASPLPTACQPALAQPVAPGCRLGELSREVAAAGHSAGVKPWVAEASLPAPQKMLALNDLCSFLLGHEIQVQLTTGKAAGQGSQRMKCQPPAAMTLAQRL